MLWLTVVTAFAVSCLLTFYLARPDAKLRIVDHPNERSLHEHPTPRTGGVAVLFGIVIGGLWFGSTLGSDREIWWTGGAAVVLALISFLDDKLDIPAILRLLVHIATAAALISAGLVIERLTLPTVVLDWPGWLGALVTGVYVVWMINLYNFMDGMDGFAGGMTAIGFASLGILGWVQDVTLFAGLCWIIAASSLGFLVWNFPPARIFMGDAGSSTLGLLVAACSIWADEHAVAPLWVSVLIFSPFIVDASVTLVRRALRGEAVWKAHRSHYYQRLAVAGWGHRRTVLWEYGLMLACAASAIMVTRADEAAVWGWLAIGAWAVIYLILAAATDRIAPYRKEEVTCQGS